MKADAQADDLDGQAQASLALFQIQQDNLPEFAVYLGDNDQSSGRRPMRWWT